MKIKTTNFASNSHHYGTLLFDLKKDPNQENPLADAEIEGKMIKLLVKKMKENEAPLEQYERLGLTPEGESLK